MLTQLATELANPTIWGLDPLQLHAHYWASLGVQVVRQGEPSQIVPHAELFLLTDPLHAAAVSSCRTIIQMLEWVEPSLITLRVHDTRERTYLERAISDESRPLPAVRARVRRQRPDHARDADARARTRRVVDERSPDPVTGYRRVKRFVHRGDRVTRSVEGKLFDRASDDEIAAFLERARKTLEAARRHHRPGAALRGERRVGGPGCQDRERRPPARLRVGRRGPDGADGRRVGRPGRHLGRPRRPARSCRTSTG